MTALPGVLRPLGLLQLEWAPAAVGEAAAKPSNSFICASRSCMFSPWNGSTVAGAATADFGNTAAGMLSVTAVSSSADCCDAPMPTGMLAVASFDAAAAPGACAETVSVVTAEGIIAAIVCSSEFSGLQVEHAN